MLSDFRAEADLRGGQVNLTWRWVAPDQQPELCLRRRKGFLPIGPEDGELVAEHILPYDEEYDPAYGIWTRYYLVNDLCAATEQVYAYQLFERPPGSDAWVVVAGGRAMAWPTGHYGLAERLYELLPAMHRRYDEAEPQQQGQGQLRRFLQIFGLGLDHVRSLAEGLRERHDLQATGVDRLPYLAQWIGWDLDHTLDQQAQREQIRFAPTVYQSVGSEPNLRALIAMAAGQQYQIKDFAQNIFLTNAAETIRLWELWQMRYTIPQGNTKVPPWSRLMPVTHTDEFDGRPAPVVDGQGRLWLFWHALRNGNWRIHFQVRDGEQWGEPEELDFNLLWGQTTKQAAYLDPVAVTKGDMFRLFWVSDRSGSWDIYTLGEGRPVRLTAHPAADRRPAAVCLEDDTIVLVWQSQRGDAEEIWLRRWTKDEHDTWYWEGPRRVPLQEQAGMRRSMPAVAIDDDAVIWLFYVADLATQQGSAAGQPGEAQGGYRRNIYCQTSPDSGQTWAAPIAVTSGPQRDEAPAAVLWKGLLQLFWHTNVYGRWTLRQCWGKRHKWSRAIDVPHPLIADKEPAVVVDEHGASLLLFWRSQRRGQDYLSKTIDVGNEEQLALLKQQADRAHYSYDTGRADRDWYALDTFGLYPAAGGNDPVRNRRIGDFVAPFLPVPARIVFPLDEQAEEA